MKFFKTRKLSLFYWALVALISTTSQALAQPDLAERERDNGQLFQTRNIIFQLSPDARYLAVCETRVFSEEANTYSDPNGSQVRVWEIATGRLKWSNRSAANFISPLLFSPDGNRLICYGARLLFKGSRVIEATPYRTVWDVATGQVAYELEMTPIERNGSLAFSADGKSLMGNVVIEGKKPDGSKSTSLAVKVWDAASGKQLQTRTDLPTLADSGKWVVAGEILVTNSYEFQGNQLFDSKINLWSLPDFKLTGFLPLKTNMQTLLVVARDQSRIAWNSSGSQNLPPGQIQASLWNFKTEEPVPLKHPEAAHAVLLSLDFSQDGQFLVGSGHVWDEGTPQRGELWFWNPQNGELLQTLKMPGREGTPSQVRLLPDGKTYIVLDGNEKPELRNLESHTLIRTFE